ncbi:MAG: ATPase [Candidatus Micrarchaeia archaeon]
MIEMSTAITALGAAIAITGGAIGTGIVQAAIGSSGMGLLAEKPDLTGQVLIYLVIPETIVIFGFVIALLIVLGAGLI